MKPLLSLILIITLSSLAIAQTTAIPDPNFEQLLIAWGHDVSPINGSVPTANIDTIIGLDAWGAFISDFTGLQDFTALKWFRCNDNQLTTLDISQNTALTDLWCEGNLLTSLDISQNLALTFLACNNNLLTSLDISQNLLLSNLYCSNNSLSTLDVSQHSNLAFLECNSNQLTKINVSLNPLLQSLQCDSNLLICVNVKNGNNTNFWSFYARDNPNLTCIEVDNVAWSTSNWTNIDIQTSFNTNCGNPCVVGINEYDLSNLLLYPNPTTGSITIDLGEIKQGIQATLTNSLGQVISKEQFETDIININIDSPSGIYFLKIETVDGETKTVKIIKE